MPRIRRTSRVCFPRTSGPVALTSHQDPVIQARIDAGKGYWGLDAGGKIIYTPASKPKVDPYFDLTLPGETLA